ncbi:MAG: hypothetical protein IKO57_12790 [Treponema sp.]|nr:hypothetical protein [Treponema sp.]
MKKSMIALATLAMLGTSAAAYNPPAGGQNMLRLTSPFLLTDAKSAAGGALTEITPDSVVNNPAIAGFAQRSSLGLSGTMLFDSNDPSDTSLGGAFDLGLTIASRWCVPTFLVQGVFSEYEHMNLGNNIAFTAGYSKDITDNLSVGLSGNFGLLWGAGSDWTLSAALGTYYNAGEVGFLKNLRFGVALTNLGKMYTDTEAWGIDSSVTTHDDGTTTIDYADAWPALATLRIGAAAHFIDTDAFKLGLSVDVASPGFQNVVFDAGLQMRFFDIVKLSTAWEFDLQEYSKNEYKNLMPSVGLSFNILIKSKSETLKKHDWDQSEITTGAAWQRLYENVDAVSAGVILDLGLRDTQPPEIKMW